MTDPIVTTPHRGETILYRVFDADGNLLYVGITFDISTRLAAHRNEKEWWSEVVSISTESFKSRDDAARSEVAAIQSESPVYNRIRPTLYRADNHLWRTRPHGPAAAVKVSRISRSGVSIPTLMGMAEIGSALGLSKQRANTITGQEGLGFPAPVVTYLACGRLWLKTDVDAWVAGPHGREWRERRGRYGRAEARRPGGTGRHTAHTPDGTT